MVHTRLPIILLLALFSLNMSAVPATGPGEFVGHWEGLADAQIAFTIDITLEDKQLVAVLNSPDQEITDLTSDWTEFSGDHELQISFDLENDTSLMIDGELDEEGVFHGTYDMGEQTGVISMTRIEED